MRIPISPTVAAVIETEVLDLAADPGAFGLDDDETTAYQLLARCYRGRSLEVSADDRATVSRLLLDLCNGADDRVEYGQSADPVFDRRAVRSLSSLIGKVRRTP